MSAKIIAHSRSSVNGQEIITFELEYPRIVHSELMTHRLLSRNAASSRAIPIDKLIGLVESGCAMPVEWGLNQAGMKAKGVHDNPSLCEEAWLRGAKRAIQTTRELQGLGLHKQVCNRPLECYQYIKTIVTATEWDNWFWLRNHKDADPTLKRLAEEMWEAKEASTPQLLNPFEYHLPYINCEKPLNPLSDYWTYKSDSGVNLTLDEALKVSTSCCAQVSYRVLDGSLSKAVGIYTQLVDMDRVHASPFEHQATPMEVPFMTGCAGGVCVEDLIKVMIPGEHMDWKGNFWSGNFKGWEQYRQQIPGNTCWNLKEGS